jgi:hypothetical protein
METPYLEIVECQADIPVKAKCSCCADVEFTAIPQSVEKNRQLLNLMFAEHLKRVHMGEPTRGDER